MTGLVDQGGIQTNQGWVSTPHGISKGSPGSWIESGIQITSVQNENVKCTSWTHYRVHLFSTDPLKLLDSLSLSVQLADTVVWRGVVAGFSLWEIGLGFDSQWWLFDMHAAVYLRQDILFQSITYNSVNASSYPAMYLGRYALEGRFLGEKSVCKFFIPAWVKLKEPG